MAGAEDKNEIGLTFVLARIVGLMLFILFYALMIMLPGNAVVRTLSGNEYGYDFWLSIATFTYFMGVIFNAARARN